MNELKVDTLTFRFPNRWKAEKYDEWDYYKQKFQHVCGGAKGVDIVALEPRECCWLIEAKDFRVGRRDTIVELADKVAKKCRDTLAGLATIRAQATGAERIYADESLSTTRLRVVFHLEQPAVGSILHPSVIDRANLKSLLLQRIKAIDPKLEVVDIASSVHLAWEVK